MSDRSEPETAFTTISVRYCQRCRHAASPTVPGWDMCACAWPAVDLHPTPVSIPIPPPPPRPLLRAVR
jgi:hypothetical protein